MSDPMVPGFHAVGDAATFPVADNGQVFEVARGCLGAIPRDAEVIA